MKGSKVWLFWTGHEAEGLIQIASDSGNLRLWYHPPSNVAKHLLLRVSSRRISSAGCGVDCSSHSIRELVFRPSQAGLVPAFRSQSGGGISWSGLKPNSKSTQVCSTMSVSCRLCHTLIQKVVVRPFRKNKRCSPNSQQQYLILKKSIARPVRPKLAYQCSSTCCRRIFLSETFQRHPRYHRFVVVAEEGSSNLS